MRPGFSVRATFGNYRRLLSKEKAWLARLPQPLMGWLRSCGNEKLGRIKDIGQSGSERLRNQLNTKKPELRGSGSGSSSLGG